MFLNNNIKSYYSSVSEFEEIKRLNRSRLTNDDGSYFTYNHIIIDELIKYYDGSYKNVDIKNLYYEYLCKLDDQETQDKALNEEDFIDFCLIELYLIISYYKNNKHYDDGKSNISFYLCQMEKIYNRILSIFRVFNYNVSFNFLTNEIEISKNEEK